MSVYLNSLYQNTGRGGEPNKAWTGSLLPEPVYLSHQAATLRLSRNRHFGAFVRFFSLGDFGGAFQLFLLAPLARLALFGGARRALLFFLSLQKGRSFRCHWLLLLRS